MLDQDFTSAGHAALEGFGATRIAPRYPEWARHWLVKHILSQFKTIAAATSLDAG